MTAPFTPLISRPDGQTLASSGRDGAIILWDVASGTRRHTLQDDKGSVRSLAFSPDGKTLASTGHDASDPPVGYYDGRTTDVPSMAICAQVRCVAFSPDGSLLVSASDDETVKIWDLSEHNGLVRWTAHSNWIRTVAFSPDGRTLASCSDDGTVKTLGCHDRATASGFYGPYRGRQRSCFFPRRRSCLRRRATTDRSTYGTSRPGNMCRHSLGIPISSIRWRFRRTESVWLPASKDMTVRLYDVSSGRDIASFKAHDGPVMSVRFSPSGTSACHGQQRQDGQTLGRGERKTPYQACRPRRLD